VLVSLGQENSLPPHRPEKVTFASDFRQFFVRGLAALLPTLITLLLLLWMWNSLWEYLGQHLIYAVRWIWLGLVNIGLLPERPAGFIRNTLDKELFRTQLLGVLLAVLLVYIVGLLVGNLIGRTFWKLGEKLVMKIPVVRAIYPAVKQITDFLLTDRSHQFEFSRVVAVEPHEKGIWSIGLVTGGGLKPLEESTGQEMVTVFVPSSPTAFSGYVLVVPRASVVELPLKVEEAMRLLVSGGVLSPPDPSRLVGRSPATPPVKPESSSAESSDPRPSQLGA
jgi:uncharacterized membrane protein